LTGKVPSLSGPEGLPFLELDPALVAECERMKGPPSLHVRVDLEARTVRLFVDIRDEDEEHRLRAYVSPIATEIAASIVALLEQWCAE